MQKLVAKISTEAEPIGISDGLTKSLWTRNFWEAQVMKVKPVQLWQDNQSTICLARRGKSTSNRTRHVAIRYFFIRYFFRMDSGEVEISYLPTERMVADFFTKPLQGAVFLQHRAMLMILCSFEKPSLISLKGCVEWLYRSPICCELTEAGLLEDLDLWLRFVINHKRLK